MPSKALIFMGMMIGSVIGGYIPMLFGADMFSLWGIMGSGIGAILGILMGNRLSDF